MVYLIFRRKILPTIQEHHLGNYSLSGIFLPVGVPEDKQGRIKYVTTHCFMYHTDLKDMATLKANQLFNDPVSM